MIPRPTSTHAVACGKGADFQGTVTFARPEAAGAREGNTTKNALARQNAERSSMQRAGHRRQPT